jgi:hypothetical protein
VPLQQEAFVDKLNKRYGNKEVQQRAEEYDVIPELPELTVDIPLKRNYSLFKAKALHRD